VKIKTKLKAGDLLSLSVDLGLSLTINVTGADGNGNNIAIGNQRDVFQNSGVLA
jgi:hypothetical protein